MSKNLRYAAAALAATALCAIGGASAQSADDAVALPREVVAAAVAFQDYVQRASTVSSNFKDAKGVYDGVRAGAAYESGQFQQGMIGYGAMAAVQDDRFVDGINRAARGPAERHALAELLMADPNAVMQIEGAVDAGRRVQAALQRPGEALIANGKRMKQAAYDVQRQSWSKTLTPVERRLAEIKTLSATRAVFHDGDEAKLIKSLIDHPRADGSGPVTPLVARSLALGAIAVLGEARSQDMPRLGAIFHEPFAAGCLRMSKLMLNQCMAVAAPQYENVFCLGVHALSDTGQCVVAAAAGRGAMPLAPTMVAANVAPAYQTASSVSSAYPPASIGDLLDRPMTRVRSFRAE